MHSKAILAFGILFLLAACNAQVEDSRPLSIPEKPETWSVGFTESTSWLIDLLPACADAAPKSGVLVYQVASKNNGGESLDLLFTWGEADFQFQNIIPLVEREELLIVVHPSVPYQELTKEQAAGLLSGEITDWGNLNPISSFAGPVSLWRYIPQSDAEQGLLLVMGIGPDGSANVVASTEGMQDALLSTQFSIGYMPAHTLTGDLTTVTLSDSDPLELPVLVGAQKPFTPDQDNWLACLRQKIASQQEPTP